MAKKSKLQSTFRTTWNSIKAQCDPDALKRCSFNSGLGPALDKAAEQIDPLYELEEIPEKTVKAVEKSVKEIQATIVKYRDQVLKENEKHPELGPSWQNLHEALRRVDTYLVDEVREFKELKPKFKKLDGWKDKKEFERRAVEGGQKTDTSHAQEVETLVKKLAQHRGDPQKILSVLGGKTIGGCFPYSAALAERIIREATNLDRAVPFIAAKVKQDPPDVTNARQALNAIKEKLDSIEKLLGRDADLLAAFMKKFVYDVLAGQIASVAT